MPFMIPVLAAIGGGSALAGGVALAGTAAGAYGAISSANSAKKLAGQAGAASQIDINALDEQTRRIARQNAEESAALEKALTPEVPELRTAANQGILRGLGGDSDTTLTREQILAGLGKDVGSDLNTPLLRDAIARARQDLALGGELPLDVRNLVTRRALATSGGVTGNLGLGRDISARDLGLTSLDLANRRLATAGTLGGQEMALGQANNDTAFNNAAHQLNLIQLLRAGSDSAFNRNLLAAQYGQSIQQPVVGLDPSSVANIAVGNQNATSAALTNKANILGAQGNNYLQLAGNLAGNSLLNYNSGRSGVGSQMTYDEFLRRNPTSGAATGR